MQRLVANQILKANILPRFLMLLEIFVGLLDLFLTQSVYVFSYL